jgi:host factor-I protein
MDKDANGGMNIQDGYLGRARKEKAWLTVFLNSGKKIVGRIKSFDRYTVILEDRGSEQMIFKHAIATINVTRSFGNPINFDRTGKGREVPARPAPGGPEDAVAAADTATEDRPKVPTAD